ncbi:M28 family peptidase [candidate division KSB1 bacterium]|nr:M28 family peptidase [candidate division KSB1 bacterium]
MFWIQTNIHSQTISADSLKRHITYLGDDALQGRGTGTEGEQIAARYIAERLKSYGISEKGDHGSYFQYIPMHGSMPTSQSRLRLIADSLELYCYYDRDYLCYQIGPQTFIPTPVPLVFVGYGIIAPEFDYNDYQELDVAGKVVVFLSGEPFSNDPNYFAGAQSTIYSYPESKQRIAISRGAVGSILIPTTLDDHMRPWEYWQQVFSFEDVKLAYSVASAFHIVMNQQAARLLFDYAEYPLYQVLDMDRTNTIRSFPLEISIKFDGDFKERDFLARNVVGMLPGHDTDLRDSYVLLSAHYDHLGFGKPVQGDSIYNGVFDNAAGVAALLELARVFQQSPDSPACPLIFLFTTGEEKGLLGATYYTDHPVVPLYRTKANINIDGLAMFDTFRDIVGVGSEYSTLRQHLQEVARELGLKVSSIPSEFLTFESFARSDQIAFAKAGVPSILIAEGFHCQNIPDATCQGLFMEWMQQRYHTPFDDLMQAMNLDAAVQHCEVIREFCRHVAEQKHIDWYPGGPFVNERLRSIAEKR